MKKSFMTRVVAVSLSAAMAFSLSAANMATASAATKYVALSAKSVTLKAGAKKTLKLKNNSLKWKVTSATSARKDVVTATKKSTSVVLKAKNCKKKHKNVKVTVKLKTSNKKKNNTKKLVCKVTVNPKSTTVDPGTDDPTPPTPEGVKISSATATSKTNVDVKFSAVLDQATLVKENFKVAEEGVTVENVEVRDGMTVTLTLAGAEAGKTYTLNVTGLKDADGKAVDALSATFTMQADAAKGYHLELKSSSEKNQLKADGYAELPIVCEVKDPNGNTIKDKNYTIRFTTDRGSFSRPDVVTTEGKTENILKSVALDVAQTAHVTAEIIRVEGEDQENLRGKKETIDINMTPVLEGISTPVVIGAESGYADRLTLFFQDAIEDDYFKTNGQIDTSKVKIEVVDDITAQQAASKNFRTVENNDGSGFTTDPSIKGSGQVVNLRAVAENNRALQVLVNKPLSNNRHIGVRVQLTDPATKKTTTYTETFVLTDSETPRVMKVETQGRRTLIVTYSEAVLPESVALGNNKAHNAQNVANYLVGGRALNLPMWGEDPTQAAATIGSGKDGEDDRNVVTIKLGERKIKDSDNKEIVDYPRFDVGDNILTVQNVGDWASNTSGVNNIITTDTKNFHIDDDPTQPAIKEVEVQSPEQYMITFNAPVAKVFSDDFFEVKNADSETSSETNQNETSILQLRENDKNIGAKDGDNPIRVTKVTDEKYLVETTKDWTKVYGELGSTYNDYFYGHKYKLVIGANKLINKDNGMKNASEISYDLSADPKMQAPDTTPPTMTEMTWTGSKANVKFSEPIKIRQDNSAKGLNKEGSTPSVKQSASWEKGIQQSAAQFISPSVGRTIKGKFVDLADDDMSVAVEPEEELPSAKDWTLHITGISDDYGNTGTVSKTFEVTGTVAGFRVAWASVSKSKAYGQKLNAEYWDAGTGTLDPNGNRYIFVKFTNAVNKNSIVFDARNYSINSNQVPSDAYVLQGIEGYDDNSNVIDSVTLVIPKRSAYIIDDANQGRNITLTISDRVTSSSGQVLADLVEMTLPYNHDLREGTTTTDDAVFGDDSSEQYGSFNDSPTDYKAAIENAIRSDKCRKIILTKDISGGLNITRPVDIELNGNSISGEVKATFNDGATCRITNKGVSARIATIKISTPNADWESFDNSNKIEYGKVDIRAIASKTFKNDGSTIKEVEVNTGSSNAKIVNKSGTIEILSVNNVANKNVKVEIANAGTIKNVAVKNPSTIAVVKGGDNFTDAAIDLVTVEATKDVTIDVAEGAKKVTNINGNGSAFTVKQNGKDAETTDVVENPPVNSDPVGIVSAVASNLKSSVVVTSGTALLSDVAKVSEKFINNSEISDEYNIVIKVGSNDALVTDLLDGARNKFKSDSVTLTTEAENGMEITVYVVKKDITTAAEMKDKENSWRVKTLKVEVKEK